MFVKQLCIFVENRRGRLEELTDILAKNDINLISMSLADTADYGVVRLIVSDPDKAQDSLIKNGFASVVNNIIAVKLPHKKGALNSLLKEFVEAKVDVEYAYALTSGKDASILLKTSNDEKACEIIKAKYAFFPAEDIYNM